MINYFAYGSNMNRNRMIERGCAFEKVMKASLFDHKLVFNKRSFKDPSITFANIETSIGSTVEGMLYRMEDNMIELLDKFEGFPKHYTRNKLKVFQGDDEVYAWVYIAHQKWISESGNPTKEYMDHLLEGSEFLSLGYYNLLKEKRGLIS